MSILRNYTYLHSSRILYTHTLSLQSRPVIFTVSAQVTQSDITFDKDAIEFGPCTTHESVVTTLQLTNTSILPQSFGFINLPSYVDVQPGDGFGELLPNETLSVDVIFSAEKPKEYSFILTIKSAIDKYVVLGSLLYSLLA